VTLRAVLFDVDGTLYRQAPLRRAMLLKFLRAHALRPLAGWRTARVLDAYRRALEHLRDSPEVLELGDAQLQLTCQWTRLDPQTVAECVGQWIEREPLGLVRRYLRPGLHDFIDACVENGLRLGLLSDYPAEPKLHALGLEGVFDAVLSAQSPEIGVFKPNPRGLLALARRLEVDASECVYIGDRPEIDGRAAWAAGMRCLIVGRHQGFPELQRLLLAQPTLDPR
jgi:HAD superfamily hydrolase (TIGR01549 family)